MLKFKPKRGYKVRTATAPSYPLEIGEIKLLTRKPAAKKAGGCRRSPPPRSPKKEEAENGS